MARTDVRFVDGFDEVCVWPKFARAANLAHRFAVIQETYRPDSVDMYFDQRLWLSLLDFAKRSAPSVRIGISRGGAKKVELDAFFSGWMSLPQEDREPPPLVFVENETAPTLIIETEYWKNVGGPMPYHDSYTYSLYSSAPLSDAVMKHLADANDGQWNLAPQPIRGFPTAPKKRLRLW